MPKLLSHPFSGFSASRPVPLLSSFAGVFDIKLGVTIISLLALLNKVAGVYGILAVFTGGSIAQVTMYVYSIITIAMVIYGLKSTGEESPKATLVYANMLLVDHMVSTFYTAIFGVTWYAVNPHDGRRVANSEAQQQMAADAGAPSLSFEQQRDAAQAIWNEERGFATAVLVLTWLIKIYFIIVVYSFALHLQRGTYSTLPLSKPPSSIITTPSIRRTGSYAYSHLRQTSIQTEHYPPSEDE